MTLDKATREAIAQAVRKAMIEMQEVYQEQWLTGEQLCEACATVHKGMAAQVWADAAEGVREGDNARRCDAQDGKVLPQDKDTADVGRR